MNSKGLVLTLVLGTFACAPAPAQDGTLIMSILNSRQHQWGRDDNPVIGIFVSTDAGRTWLHRGWREYIRTFYTEEGPDGTLWSACGNGVLRSTDGGILWRVTTGWDVTEVLKVKTDPGNSRRVLAATAYGLIVSTDNGTSWHYRMNGVSRRFTSDVCIDRTDGNTAILATELGVVRSTNGCELWEPTGLRETDTRIVVQDQADPRVFWAGTEDKGVWKSTDRGLSWFACNAGLGHATVYAIALDPGGGWMYVGTHGGGVYRSTDNGGTWTQASQGITIPDIHALTVLQPSGVVFAGSLNGGLFQSEDHGGSWQFNSQPEAQVWGLSWRGPAGKKGKK